MRWLWGRKENWSVNMLEIVVNTEKVFSTWPHTYDYMHIFWNWNMSIYASGFKESQCLHFVESALTQTQKWSLLSRVYLVAIISPVTIEGRGSNLLSYDRRYFVSHGSKCVLAAALFGYPKVLAAPWYSAPCYAVQWSELLRMDSHYALFYKETFPSILEVTWSVDSYFLIILKKMYFY